MSDETLNCINERYEHWLGPNSHLQFNYLNSGLHAIGYLPDNLIYGHADVDELRMKLEEAIHQIEIHYNRKVTTDVDFIDFRRANLVDWNNLVCNFPFDIVISEPDYQTLVEKQKIVIVDVWYKENNHLVFSYLPLIGYSFETTHGSTFIHPPPALRAVRMGDNNIGQAISINVIHDGLKKYIKSLISQFAGFQWPKVQVEVILTEKGRTIKRKSRSTRL